MGKRRQNESVDIKKDSTVFSDPHKKEAAEVIAAKKKKKRIITIIAVAIVMAIVVLPWGIAKIIESNKAMENSVKPLKTRVERYIKEYDVEPDDLAKKLYSLINHDPTDVAATKIISSNLGITALWGNHEITVYENETGYTMRFAFEKPHSTSIDGQFGLMMENYAVAFMALVDDITAFEWTCPSPTTAGEVKSEQITLENVVKVLNGSPKEYIISEKALHYMIIEHDLNNISL